jgi:hypothetical protein
VTDAERKLVQELVEAVLPALPYMHPAELKRLKAAARAVRILLEPDSLGCRHQHVKRDAATGKWSCAVCPSAQ